MVRDELRNPDVLRRIGELKSSGKSWTGIKAALYKEFKLDVGTSSIVNCYNIYRARGSEIIEGDDRVKEIIKKSVLDTADQLNYINKSMQKIIDNADREESKDVISAAREVLNQLYFQEKLLNRLSTGFDPKQISKIEYTKVSVNNLEELEKAGYIKILTRPGKVVDIEPTEKKGKILDFSIYEDDSLKSIKLPSEVINLLKKSNLIK